MADTLYRRKAKKLRLLTFLVEAAAESNSPWLRRAWRRADSNKNVREDQARFLAMVEDSGVSCQGTTLCNAESTGGNDILLIYPWLHISSTLQDINTWVRREQEREVSSMSMSRSGSLDRLERMGRSSMKRVKLVQGTYMIVESVVPGERVVPAGEELCVLLGFRTTEDNCVDTLEADRERSEEARAWREWTGIGTLYQNLAKEDTVEVIKVEFLESHIPDHTAVFPYLVLLFLQVDSHRGKLNVLDVVARFRVRNMSGYVTVYSNLSDVTVDDRADDCLGDNLKTLQHSKQEAKKMFFKQEIIQVEQPGRKMEE